MRPVAAVLALALLSLARPAAVSPQSFQATLSRDTVPMGEVFELIVRVPVPPGSAVFFPDTVARTEVLESHGPVRWAAEAGASGGGATLTLTYPVIAWGAGGIPVPGFDVFVAPGGAPPAGAATLPGGSHVGAWPDAPARGDAFVRPLRVPRRGVWVTPVFGEEQLEAGVEPMPAADVLGGSWHVPSVALGLLFAGGLLALGFGAWRRAAGGDARLGDTGWTPAASRQHALDQLDGLLAEKLHVAGRTHELYTRSSGIVRTFVGRIDASLGSHLTSTELMGRLRGRTNGQLGDTLFREMGTAEVVKFGRARPVEAEAERHIRSLRAWVAASGDAP